MFWKSKAPPSPNALKEGISEKAERRAAKIIAKGASRTLIERAKAEHHSESLGVKTVRWSSYILFFAGILIIGVGYWFDVVFYTQQSDIWYVSIGLLLFAIVIRSIAALGDVMLHWTKPGADKSEDEDAFGIKDLATGIIKSDSDRHWLRIMWIGSIAACFIATLSFFSAGHEARQDAGAGIEQSQTTLTDTKQTRIDALEAQRTAAKEARDTALAEANATIQSVRDETPNVSASDNQTIQKAEDSKVRATDRYNDKSDEIDALINQIRAEEAEETVLLTEQKNASPPFISVYEFLSRGFGTANGWAIAGAWFFSVLFEIICAKLLAVISALTKWLRRIAKSMSLREATDSMTARIALDRMKSNIEIESLRLEAQRRQEEADAEIELALRLRAADKARAQAEALRNGVPWVDPDILVNEQANLERAKIDKQIADMRAEAERLRNGEQPLSPQAPPPPPPPEPPKPDPEAPLTPSQVGRLGAAARNHYRKALEAGKIEVAPPDYMVNRQTAVQEPAE